MVTNLNITRQINACERNNKQRQAPSAPCYNVVTKQCVYVTGRDRWPAVLLPLTDYDVKRRSLPDGGLSLLFQYSV